MVPPTAVVTMGLATTHHGRLLCSHSRFTGVAGTAVASGHGAVVAAMVATTAGTGAAMAAGAAAGSLPFSYRAVSQTYVVILGQRPVFLTS
ncbi:MAG: hypothetical protein ACRYG7_26460 [Janthinobacterium lividum]